MRQFAILALAAAAVNVGTDAQAGTPAGTYTIREQTTLFEIALRLYGKSSLWPKIAKWNSLEEPYRIRIGQTLILQEPPTLTPAQGNQAVLEYWRKKMNLAAAKSSPAPVAVAAPSPAPVAVAAPSPAPMIEGPQELFDEGKLFFEQKNYGKALEKFRSSRVLNPDLLGSWFFEFSALKHLDRNQEARQTSALLLGRRPELRALPVFQDLRD